LGIVHIPFQNYDISKDKPDMVFISNPYESVTTEQFWPETIAKYSKLVYLPYYTGMIISDESIQVHCCMPVAKCAWRIIAQSQKVKEMHKKYAPKHGENVIVTGLPKWDDIINLMQETVTVHMSWEKKLKGKKVFLWNSHFSVGTGDSTLLDYGKAILELFSNRDDIALIWRPHPMTETIFKLYYPQYASLWRDMKDTVEISNNMIFDTNFSYNMAFQCSDALISDFSSIIVQYMLVEKPILWLKKPLASQGGSDLNTSEYLIRFDCSELAATIDEIFGFVERVVQGIDLKKEERLKIMHEDLPCADGHVGERVCDLLLDELRKEDNL